MSSSFVRFLDKLVLSFYDSSITTCFDWVVTVLICHCSTILHHNEASNIFYYFKKYKVIKTYNYTMKYCRKKLKNNFLSNKECFCKLQIQFDLFLLKKFFDIYHKEKLLMLLMDR